MLLIYQIHLFFLLWFLQYLFINQAISGLTASLKNTNYLAKMKKIMNKTQGLKRYNKNLIRTIRTLIKIAKIITVKWLYQKITFWIIGLKKAIYNNQTLII